MSSYTMPFPGPPVVESIAASNASIVVNFTAPSYTGGLPVLAYMAFTNHGDYVGATPMSPIVLTNLVGDSATSYNVMLCASNVAGAGPYTTASVSVQPYYVSSAPSIVGSVKFFNNVVTASCSVPTYDGGVPIDSYVWSFLGNGLTTVTTSYTPFVSIPSSNFQGGVVYSVTAKASNAAGLSMPSVSAQVVAVTPGSLVGCGILACNINTLAYYCFTSNVYPSVTMYTGVASNLASNVLVTSAIFFPPSMVVFPNLSSNTPYDVSITSYSPGGVTTSTASSIIRYTPLTGPFGSIGGLIPPVTFSSITYNSPGRSSSWPSAATPQWTPNFNSFYDNFRIVKVNQYVTDTPQTPRYTCYYWNASLTNVTRSAGIISTSLYSGEYAYNTVNTTLPIVLKSTDVLQCSCGGWSFSGFLNITQTITLYFDI